MTSLLEEYNNLHFLITDVPYENDVNYDELADFFLVWAGKSIEKILGFKKQKDQSITSWDMLLEKFFEKIYKNNTTAVVMMMSSKESVIKRFHNRILGNGLKITTIIPIQVESGSSITKKSKKYTLTLMYIIKRNLYYYDNKNKLYTKTNLIMEDLSLSETDIKILNFLKTDLNIMENLYCRINFKNYELARLYWSISRIEDFTIRDEMMKKWRIKQKCLKHGIDKKLYHIFIANDLNSYFHVKNIGVHE